MSGNTPPADAGDAAGDDAGNDPLAFMKSNCVGCGVRQMGSYQHATDAGPLCIACFNKKQNEWGMCMLI